VKESEVQRSILDYLKVKRVFHYRNNSGAFVFPETSTHARRFIKAGVAGSPDIVCVIKGQYVGIEVKAPKGKQNPNQIQFQQDLERAGGRYILAYSLDDVIEAGL
jgi:hypothetical protein